MDPGALPGWLGNGWLVMELRWIKWLNGLFDEVCHGVKNSKERPKRFV